MSSLPFLTSDCICEEVSSLVLLEANRSHRECACSLPLQGVNDSRLHSRCLAPFPVQLAAVLLWDTAFIHVFCESRVDFMLGKDEDLGHSDWVEPGKSI